MKRYGMVLAGSLALIMGGVGCHSLYTGQADQSPYVLNAMFVEGPPSEFKQVGGNTTSKIVRSPDNASVDALLRSSRVTVVKFPSLRLRFGKYSEASNQHSVLYPIGIDDKSEPKAFEEKNVGQKIRARLVEEKDLLLTVDLYAEDIKEPQRPTAKKGEGVTGGKQSAFRTRQVSPIVSIPANTWFIAGGLGSETNTTMFLMKVNRK